MNSPYTEWLARQQHDEIARTAKQRDGWRLYDAPAPSFGAWLRGLAGLAPARTGEAQIVVRDAPEAPESVDKSPSRKAS